MVSDASAHLSIALFITGKQTTATKYNFNTKSDWANVSENNAGKQIRISTTREQMNLAEKNSTWLEACINYRRHTFAKCHVSRIVLCFLLISPSHSFTFFVNLFIGTAIVVQKQTEGKNYLIFT